MEPSPYICMGSSKRRYTQERDRPVYPSVGKEVVPRWRKVLTPGAAFDRLGVFFRTDSLRNRLGVETRIDAKNDAGRCAGGHMLSDVECER
jgi:hypothetical protein